MKQGQCPLDSDLGGALEDCSSMDIQLEAELLEAELLEAEPQEAEEIQKEDELGWAQTEKVQHFHP